MANPSLSLPIRRPNPLLAALRRSILLFEQPIPAGVIAGIIFLGLASVVGVPWRSSSAPYFNYLADAFLHGQLSLRLIPAQVLDLSVYQGRYFLYWSPLPAIFAMPLVALFGVQVSDILQTVFLGAVNAGLCALLLRVIDRQGWLHLDPFRRGLLVIFFVFGTAQAPLPAVGTVWFLVQLESITAALLAFIAAFSLKNEKAFFWTGCAVAGLLLTRMSAIFIALFLAWHLLRSHWHIERRLLARFCLLGVLPILFAVLAMLAYNGLRFGDILENGVRYHRMGEVFSENFQRYGLLNLHYVPLNLYLGYIYYPLATIFKGYLWVIGGSLFLLSPLFLAGIYDLWQDRRDADTWVLFAAVALGNIPALMVMAPGSTHFGPRYFLDFVLPLFLLTMRGAKRWPDRIVVVLILASVLQYLIGSLAMAYAFK